MRFTVVIPVYNVAPYLTRCVNSVLNNKEKDFEILLVDDGSTDGHSGPLCDTLAAENPNRIGVIHQKNCGLGGARNTGIEAARGEYLFFLDGDDTISPDTLSVLSQAVETYRHPDVIAFFLALYPEGSDTPTGLQRHSLPKNQVCTLIQCPTMLLDTPSACARLWRRDLFLKSGIRYPERLWYEDLYTTENLLLEAKSIVGLEAPLYRYLLRSGSIMRGKDPARNGEILLALITTTQETHDLTTFKDMRVLLQNPHHPLIPQFLEYLNQQFPAYRTCKYYRSLTHAQRVILFFLRHRQYRLPALLLEWKEKQNAK